MGGTVGGPGQRRALILFTKAPRPGLVKTRLIGPGGGPPSPSDVSSLYHALLEDTLSMIRDLRRMVEVSLIVSFTPEDAADEMRAMITELGEEAEFNPQTGESVTQRVKGAFRAAFAAGYHSVSLIPGDHADLDAALLAEAFQSLGSQEPVVAVGPTSDGGAYLLGFNENSFQAVDFDLEDTHLVCADIFRKAKKKRIRCTFLDNRNDIDDWDDARRLLSSDKLRKTRTWNALREIGIPRGTPVSAPKVSIIIPVLNEERVVSGVLDSLDRQKNKDFEVIVVDGGSNDETVDEVWGRANKVVFVGRPSRRRQENVAAVDARGETLLFLHADMEVPPTLIGSVVQSLSDPSVAGGSCHVVFQGDSVKLRFLSAARLCGSKLLNIHGISSAFYVRRSSFQRAGGFRDTVMEEAVDLQRRISSEGSFVTLDEICTTSARRFNQRGRFVPVAAVWIATVLLTVFGIHFTSIEERLWRSVR